MVDSLKEYQIEPLPEYMKDKKFKTYIRSMLPILMGPTSQMGTLPVTPQEGFANRFDLTGFLLDKGVSVYTHYTIMLMNGMSSVQDFNESYTVIYTPDPNVFSQLLTIYETSLS